MFDLRIALFLKSDEITQNLRWMDGFWYNCLEMKTFLVIGR